MKLRVGLIGLGACWDSRHRPALRALSERYQVSAVCCEVSRRAEIVAREFNAVALDGFRTMLLRDDIDAVLSLAPDWVGPLPILAACEAGKSVYSSAALDIAPAQASEIKRRVEESGIAFMAELPRRHSPATIRLKELIATRLGKPKLLFCHERQGCKNPEDDRYGEDCPAMTRNFMELIDWCRYIIDKEPESVGGIGHQHSIDPLAADYQMISLKFPSTAEDCKGVTAQISVGHYIPSSWRESALAYRRPASLQVCCENGIAFIDLPSTLVWFDESGQHNESLDLDRPVGEQMLTHFHRAVTSLVHNTSDLDDAYRALRIASTAQESFKQQRRLPVEY